MLYYTIHEHTLLLTLSLLLYINIMILQLFIIYIIYGSGLGFRFPPLVADEAVKTRCLDQLDRMFGSAALASPSRAALADSMIKDWSKEPFVRGAYSFPSFGARPQDRYELARPIANRVFFAGEATHTSVNPCLQAAMETGQRAAMEAAASLVAAPAAKL